MFDGSLLGVYREEIFSPGKIDEDAEILDAALTALVQRGGPRACPLKAGDLEHVNRRPEWVLSMAQSVGALALLERWEGEGTRIFNSVRSVRNCYRKSLLHLLAAAKVPVPPSRIMHLKEVVGNVSFRPSERYWLKRGDVHAIQTGDVVQVTSEIQLIKALEAFCSRGVHEILVQEHIDGEVIKFYGAGPGAYFVAFLSRPGEKPVPAFPSLMEMANRSAEVIGLEVFGGDAVLTTTGQFVLIDLNDWPSFSRCRASAAEAIAAHLVREMGRR